MGRTTSLTAVNHNLKRETTLDWSKLNQWLMIPAVFMCSEGENKNSKCCLWELPERTPDVTLVIILLFIYPIIQSFLLSFLSFLLPISACLCRRGLIWPELVVAYSNSRPYFYFISTLCKILCPVDCDSVSWQTCPKKVEPSSSIILIGYYNIQKTTTPTHLK